MTPEQLRLVQHSYATLGADAPAMATEFYRRLFAADPTAEALFTRGPDVMAEKFADELAAIVDAITSFDAFSARVSDLAARHVTYGVQTHHYRTVGDALIGALGARLGPDWSDELEAAWQRAYNLVAETMMAAAATVSPSAGPSPGQSTTA
jgi:hemoglobin-like flavoprotein